MGISELIKEKQAIKAIITTAFWPGSTNWAPILIPRKLFGVQSNSYLYIHIQCDSFKFSVFSFEGGGGDGLTTLPGNKHVWGFGWIFEGGGGGLNNNRSMVSFKINTKFSSELE